ncbi:amino acid adenylation domain-containing protein [Ideonella sp. 4Y16]|uniref:Amino acid adenylation domain-containing protein n=1 Tax=Ideonella alba TaxID=2824118 RepID=A0A940YBM3_9BURK|nr:non-ribosomal peptide synthetase [Ideonella alba]MBQ0933562.1 amino acid adenylation domain-containing protein [Ideonella alba]MBQ0946372.1 amino acid adenylation domain-containing protein [Ideonella alba]
MNKSKLTIAQQGLWYLCQSDAATSAAYNMVFAFASAQAVDTALLERALLVLCRRHESLRSAITAQAGVPSLSIQDADDLHAVPVTLVHAPLRDLALAETERPFDLAVPPLLRALVAQPIVGTDGGVVLSFPHIVFDGASAEVFLDELAAVSKALAEHREPAWLTQPLIASELAREEARYCESQAGHAALQATLSRLAGIPSRVALPLLSESRHQETGSAISGVAEFSLDVEAVKRINAAALRHRITPTAYHLAAFAALVHRYSGQADFAISMPVSNRQSPEAVSAIGYLTNLGIVRARIDTGDTVRGLLAGVQDQLFDLMESAALPFPLVARGMKRAGHSIQGPLVQLGFGYEAKPVPPLCLADQSLPPVECVPKFVKNELTLDIREDSCGLRGWLLYDRGHLDAWLVQAMARSYAVLVEELAAAAPDSPVAALRLLTEPEQNQILLGWNDTRIDFPRDKCIHQLFEEQVERSPDATAVAMDDKQLSYSQLNAKANQLAHHLRCQGVKPDTLVGICLERGLDMVIGLLSILKAGGAYVPLDADYPEERVAYILQDTGAQIVLTQSSLKARLPRSSYEIVCLDSDWSDIGSHVHLNPQTLTSSLNLAYCIYTSGSTGKPKGVLVEHGAAACHLLERSKAYRLKPGTRCLQLASINFDVSVEQLFSPLVCGATVILRGREIWSPQELLVQVRRQSIGVADIPAAYWHEYARKNLADLESLPLDTLIVGGEAVRAQACRGITLPMRVINAYGPTEAIVTATQYMLRPLHMPSGPLIPIGRPTAQRKIYILDGNLQPVPIGVTGELHIAGAGLARGYLNCPVPTAVKFIPNPFDEPGSRMYKTGDLARYLPDGNIEFLGRIDQQVKIRGFRIEVGEVEAALLDCAGIGDAVVTAREDELGDKRLVAYVVPLSGMLDIVDLRTQLSAFLPEYMIPSGWVFLNSLPLNSSGKVDRNSLPAPELSRDSLGTGYVAPRNTSEEMLAGIWIEVLGVERVGVHDNFFALGGHSLLATQIASRLAEKGYGDIGLRRLFDHPTIAALAASIDQATGAISPPEVPTITRQARRHDAMRTADRQSSSLQ